MSNIRNPLEEKYDDFLDLLKLLCDTYDNTGKEIISLSISAAIRVLVHDKGRSISLLQHLDKKQIDFLSTNTIYNNEKVHLGLVRRINVGVHNGVGGESKYWPNCDERYFPKRAQESFLNFKSWWEMEEVFISNDSTLTRKDLVLCVAENDGGTHFDAHVQKKYDDFRYSWSGGSSLVGITSGVRKAYENIPVYPAIRQIGYELLSTLRK